MNSLAHEKSPYLLQHADNPVQWHPWGPAAFARARAEQKPIFLSIGYSTCHWCHVMAHESFENGEIAALLNADFVSIKVDREERPDVDRIYMSYVQAVTGHGGWPLSAWLTPDLKPFYGGTYFPPEDRHGRPGFPSVLRAIARGWREERGQLLAEGERVLHALREREASRRPATEEGKAEADLATAAGEAFEKGFQYFYQSFDQEHGGFGGAPKFPRAANLSFLLRCAALQGPRSELGAEALRMASFTLQRMMQGGIHDHVGGGFHRYSVDEAWHVPHFEKMLYDQALIALNALEAYAATGDARLAWPVHGIFSYVARQLTHPAGGFYSGEDADSSPSPGAPKAEGAFYVWTYAELTAALGAYAPLVAAHFGASEQGNVPPASDPQGELAGKNILTRGRLLAETAQAMGISPEQASKRLGSALKQLREARARRPRPSLDDKIITAWNGLMISALARANGVLAALDPRALENEFLRRAVATAEFLQRELYDAERGVLYRSYREGRGAIEGFAEDYAYLVQGLLDLYEASFDRRWLQWAERLQRTMDATFADEANGGWFNSAANAADIVLRLKEDYDGAEPAPSSVAVMNLLRLGAIFDASGGTDSSLSYRARARRALLAFRGQWQNLPQAMPQMLCALEPALEPPRHVVLVGDPAGSDFRALAAVARQTFGRQRAVLAVTSESDRAWFAGRQPWLADMKLVAGAAAAYVCEEFTCQAPVTTPDELRRLLQQGHAP